MSSQNPERRIDKRLSDSLVIRHRLLGTQSEKERSVSRDLTQNGISIPSSKRLPSKSVVELEITLPMQLLPIFALGEIVWAKEAWENARRLYQVGIRITDMDDFDVDRMKSYVHERYSEVTN